jgi:hypothetical protein
MSGRNFAQSGRQSRRSGGSQQMRGRAGLVFVGAMIALVSRPQATFAVGACAAGCAQVASVGPAGTAKAGDTVSVGVTFTQAPDNGQSGGPDEIAAIALTLSIASPTGGTPLVLADCTLDADGLPAAVHPDAALSNPPGFKVVVENATCTATRQHCLCPSQSSGLAPDNFINMVVYGPNPLPAPGPNPIDIPVLPSGQLVTIDLKVQPSAGGAIPLRLYNQVVDSSHPQFTAFLSVGDKLAVDETCVPVQGMPPCGSGAAVSQVNITEGAVNVEGGCTRASTCAGDCDCSGGVTVTDIVKMVNIALGSQDISACLPGDGDSSGSINVTDIIKAVNNALGVCTPGS